MEFDTGAAALSPDEEWLARVYPFLPANDPHQQCILRAHETGVSDVNQVCQCAHAACDKECCR